MFEAMPAADRAKLAETIHIIDATVPEGPPEKKVEGTNPESFQFTMNLDDAGEDVLQETLDLLSADLFGLPFSVSVAVPFIDDTPLVAISSGFSKLTGYAKEDILGQNCRFLLKGVPPEEVNDETRQSARRYCKAANLRNLNTMSHNFLLQRNARKNGELFWNLFMLSLVPGPNKKKYIIGLQLDLGATVPTGTSPQAAIEPHRENLLLVQKLMFRKDPQPSLSPTDGELSPKSTRMKRDLPMIGDKIKDWLVLAEESSSTFQEWGTLPWVAWPTNKLFALTDGGVALLRLDADEKPIGADAMSIFPVQRASREAKFKVLINEVCSQWPSDMAAGGRLPSLGFTEIPPAAMDEMGGLPKHLEFTGKSLCLRGDGRVFRRSQDSHYVVEPNKDGLKRRESHAHASLPPTDEVQASVAPNSPGLSHVITAGDCLHCVWGRGYISVSLDETENELYRLEDNEELGVIIGSPPAKVPLYAIVDCCYTSCKITLMA